MAEISNLCAERNVEDKVSYARALLHGTPDIHYKKKIQILQRLDEFLRDGYEAEAWKSLEKAKQCLRAMDVTAHIIEMCRHLEKAQIEAAAWLEKNGSSHDEVRKMLEEGDQHRRKVLFEMRRQMKQKQM
jgi:hypothetical protein